MEYIEELYKKKTPTKEIMRLTGLSKGSVYNHLKRLGVEMRPAGSSSIKHPKSGYDQITNELAYIIGVMFGDGYVSKGMIGMEATDEDFVMEFKRCMEKQFGMEGSIYHRERGEFKDWRNGKTYPRKPTYEYRITSKTLEEYIRTVKNYEFIDRLNKEQKIHFIRGLWDSEGNINFNGYVKIQFTHKTEELCSIFKSVLYEVTGVESNITTNQQPRSVVQFYGEDKAMAFYKTIQPTIQRKRRIFEEIISSS